MTTHQKEQFNETKDYFFRSLSTKCLDIENGVTAYLTNVQIKDLNIVNIIKQPTSIENLINLSEQFYGRENIPFVMDFDESCVHGIENILLSRGYQEIERTIAMAINLKDTHFHYHDDQQNDTIIKSNDNNLKEWIVPLISTFESTDEIFSQYAHTHENALKKGVKLYHYSLYKADKPISSMTLYINNKIAWIDDVNTIIEYQHQGHGTQLMNFALMKAQELGATKSFLESSEAGLPMYQKLGFGIIFRNIIYSNF